jgi:hypothetical protein
MDTGVGFINLDDSVKIALNIALAVARERRRAEVRFIVSPYCPSPAFRNTLLSHHNRTTPHRVPRGGS